MRQRKNIDVSGFLSIAAKTGLHLTENMVILMRFYIAYRLAAFTELL